MSLQRIPVTVVAALTILIGVGIAIATGVNAQTETKTFSGSATFQSGDAGGSIENNTLLTQKVINLRNTGSHPDTFRTTLPINPETRCGLKGENGSYPANTLPNTLPTTLDVPLAVNGTTYISVACVMKELPAGPFTWSYKTVSVGAVGAGIEKVIAEMQDTVNVTVPIPCSDSDGGTNTGVKGIATGTYAGAVTSYVAIYGQEPSPNTPKTTTDNFSTYIDHCSWDPTQLNEGYCDANGRLQATGIKCANGCKDGVCVALTPSSAPVTCTLTLTGNKSTYTMGEMVEYTYLCSVSSDITVQYVKPDGIPVKLVQAVGGLTNTMGFSTENLPVGNYTLRICRNDPICQTPSIVGTLSFVLSSVSTSTTVSSSPATPTAISSSPSTATGDALGNHLAAPSESSSTLGTSGSPSPTPFIPATTPAITHPGGSQTTNGKVLPWNSQEKLKKLSAQTKKELQSLKNQEKQTRTKLRSINKKISSLEKKIDAKLHFLDRVKKVQVQKKVETQIDRWQAQIDSLEGQKENLESILDDLQQSFEERKAATTE